MKPSRLFAIAAASLLAACTTQPVRAPVAGDPKQHQIAREQALAAHPLPQARRHAFATRAFSGRRQRDREPEAVCGADGGALVMRTDDDWRSAVDQARRLDAHLPLGVDLAAPGVGQALTQARTGDLAAQLGLEAIGGLANRVRDRLLSNAHFVGQYLVQIAGECRHELHSGAPVSVQIKRSRSAKGSPTT